MNVYTRKHGLWAVGALLVALAYALVAVWLGAPAGADEPQTTITVAWHTGSDPAGPLPHDAGHTTWPQTYVGQLPECAPVAYVAQVDVYRYDTEADKATVDALVAAGVLQEPGQAGSDSSVVISWSYVVVAACETAAPSSSAPSTSAAASSSAPVSPSASPSCTNGPLGTVQCHPSSHPSYTPPVRPHTSGVAVPVVARSSTGSPLVAEKVAYHAPELASTGAKWLPLTIIGVTMLLAGLIVLAAGRQKRAA